MPAPTGLGAENASTCRRIDENLLTHSLNDMALQRGRYGNPGWRGKHDIGPQRLKDHRHAVSICPKKGLKKSMLDQGAAVGARPG